MALKESQILALKYTILGDDIGLLSLMKSWLMTLSYMINVQLQISGSLH